MHENITQYILKIHHEFLRLDFSVNFKAKCTILPVPFDGHSNVCHAFQIKKLVFPNSHTIF